MPRDKIKKCKYCNTTENLYTDKVGRVYSYCIKHKYTHDSERIQKGRDATIAIYGVDNVFKLEKMQDDIRAMYKDGRINTQERFEKQKKTNFEKTGYTINFYNPEKVKKGKKTLISICGEDNISKSALGKQLVSEGLLLMHADPIRHAIARKATEAGCMQTLGCKNPGSSMLVQQKIRETNYKNYGVYCVGSIPSARRKGKTTRREHYWSTLLLKLAEDHLYPCFDYDYYIDVDNTEYNYLCKDCGKTLVYKHTNPYEIYCDCHSNASRAEFDIEYWLNSIGISNIERNKNFKYRKPGNKKSWFSLDRYLPDYKVGIDFHGTYWHQVSKKGPNYHFNKHTFFKERDINCIQVFEHEWLNNPDITKSLIKSAIGVNPIVSWASCKLSSLSKIEYSTFIKTNSFNSISRENVYLGVYAETRLIGVVGFYTNTTRTHILNFVTLVDTDIEDFIYNVCNFIKYTYRSKTINISSDNRYYAHTLKDAAAFNNYIKPSSTFCLKSASLVTLAQEVLPIVPYEYLKDYFFQVEDAGKTCYKFVA